MPQRPAAETSFPTRAESRDDAEFTEWYAAAFHRVHRALSLAIGDPGLAEEAAAEAFSRALLHWHSVAPQKRDRWVYQVAFNLVRSRFRRNRLEQRWLARQRSGYHPPPAEPDTELWRAVAQLAPRARTAIALRYIADLTEAEVAVAMGIKRGTVAATLHQARARLNVMLSERRGPR